MEFVLVGWFLLPIRIVLLIMVILIGFIIVLLINITIFVFRVKNPKFLLSLIRIPNKILLLSFGIY